VSRRRSEEDAKRPKGKSKVADLARFGSVAVAVVDIDVPFPKSEQQFGNGQRSSGGRVSAVGQPLRDEGIVSGLNFGRGRGASIGPEPEIIVASVERDDALRLGLWRRREGGDLRTAMIRLRESRKPGKLPGLCFCRPHHPTIGRVQLSRSAQNL
jgi:hypothetical protein